MRGWDLISGSARSRKIEARKPRLSFACGTCDRRACAITESVGAHPDRGLHSFDGTRHCRSVAAKLSRHHRRSLARHQYDFPSEECMPARAAKWFAPPRPARVPFICRESEWVGSTRSVLRFARPRARLEADAHVFWPAQLVERLAFIASDQRHPLVVDGDRRSSSLVPGIRDQDGDAIRTQHHVRRHHSGTDAVRDCVSRKHTR